MIDPDLNNINIIPESQLTLIEIENISKIKSQNSFLRTSIIVITIAALSISLRYYYINRNRELNS